MLQNCDSFDKTKILISLDAASEKHDEIRRKPGAFARISQGISLAASHPDLRDRISIATILMPGNLDTYPRNHRLHRRATKYRSFSSRRS